MINRIWKTLAITLLMAIGMPNAGNAKAGAPYHRAGPKYIFFFIGDGMASPQIHSTEAYLAALDADDTVPGGVKAHRLIMSEFPVQGMQTSYANNRFITGSAAAGTALACGMKTNIGVIAMDPDATVPYKPLAEAAKAKGMKVGIIGHAHELHGHGAQGTADPQHELRCSGNTKRVRGQLRVGGGRSAHGVNRCITVQLEAS